MIDKTLRDAGYDITVKLVRDDFNGLEGTHTHHIIVTRNGQSMASTFTAGGAHRHYKNGKPIALKYTGGYTIHELEQNQQSIPNEPILSDVLHSLLLDASCVMYGQTFEDFAAECGYDEDSREAERIYNACRDIYFGLVRLGADFEELADLFQDY